MDMPAEAGGLRVDGLPEGSGTFREAGLQRKEMCIRDRGSTSPLSVTGSPISDASVCPPNFGVMAVCII